jgi:hypothetical protein
MCKVSDALRWIERSRVTANVYIIHSVDVGEWMGAMNDGSPQIKP